MKSGKLNHNNLTKQYYMNIEKSCYNFELCNAALETIKKILACLDSPNVPALNEICSTFLKDGPEVLALPLCNLVNLSIKESLFTDQIKIAKVSPYLKKTVRVTRKITGPSHCYLLCLR